MSTSNILKVEGAAWSVASEVENAIKDIRSSEGIVKALDLDYTVSLHNLKTDIDEPVPDFYGLYRDDTNKFLGPVTSYLPIVTQNVDSFKSVEALIEDSKFTPVVCDTYNGGAQIFGVFKYNDEYQISPDIDDNMSQYFIIINNHLKPNGEVTVINTPIRISCMNALSHALSKAEFKFQISASADQSNSVSATIQNAYLSSQIRMQKFATDLLNRKISSKGLEKLNDFLFPYFDDSDDSAVNHTRANLTIQNQRNAFEECLKADNLANYKGTMWQVYNALTDYAQHYYNSGAAAKGFSLIERMNRIPGVNPAATNESLKVTKFLKNIKNFEAKSRKAA